MSNTVLVVAKIQAKHELAVEFNEQLARLANRRKDVVTELHSRSRAEFGKLKMVYAYTAVDARLEPFLPEEVKKAEPIRVVRTWVNKEAFVHLALLFGVAAPNIPDQAISHVYYRVGHVIVKAEGNGRDLLNVNVPVTDHEWNDLKVGCPADKLLKRA